MRLCYHCDQVGHLKANYPLLAAKPAQAPTPATLRIIDGRQGRAEPPRAQGCAFQLTIKKARVTLDVVDGMFLSLILLIIYVLCLSLCTYD